MAVKNPQQESPDRRPDSALRRGLHLSRIEVARLASGFGAVGLTAALLTVLDGGDPGGDTLLAVVIGVAGLGLWMLLAPDDFRALVTGRRAVYGTNSVLISGVFIGGLIVVYSLMSGSGLHADLTGLGYYTLKSDVRPVLESLDQKIQITAFYNRLNLTQKTADAPILRMFPDAAPDWVTLVYIDPDEEPLTARAFGLTSGYGIFVSYLLPSGAPDTRTTGTVQMQGTLANERWIAEAILRLQARGKFRVLFSVGGGELSTETDATGIRDGLENVGIATGTVDLTNAEIPAETTALVMLAPWLEYDQVVTNKIAAYLAGGGKLFLMVEPGYDSRIRFMMAEDSPMAEYLWQNWGFRPNRDIVFDPLSYDTSRYYVRPARYLDGHPVVVKDETGAAARPLFSIAESWEVGSAPNVQTTVLYQTSDEGFGKRSLQEVAANPDRAQREAGDLAGPLTLVLAAQNTLNGAKIIAVGDADWVRNDQIVAFDGQFLWTNMIDWLIQFIERVSVNPVSVALPLNVSTADLDIAALITVILLPGTVLLTGLIVWWRRTRR